MIIIVLVNGKRNEIKVDNNIPIYKAIAQIRVKFKVEYKKLKQNCELWFTDIKI